MTYRHLSTEKRFRVGSEISWNMTMSAGLAMIEWEQEMQGTITEVDYVHKVLLVKGEAENRIYTVENNQITDILIF